MPSKTNSNTNDAQIVSSGSGRNSVTDSTGDAPGLPQQILAIVQHKWRNLEKRKKRLDDYKKIGENNLKPDQRDALSHFDEVVQLLDLLGDMKKQFETTFTEYEIASRRQAKSEKIAQRKRDAERMREILQIRAVVNALNDQGFRTQLVRSEKVTVAELAIVDKFSGVIEPIATTTVKDKLDSFLSSATECFERLLRREEKQFFEKMSYHQLHNVLSRLYHLIDETSPISAQIEERTACVPTEEVSHEVLEEALKIEDTKEDGPSNSVAENCQEKNQGHPKLEEIVKPGSFSFLQESQISSNNNMQARNSNNDYISDQKIGAWVPQNTSNGSVHPAENSKEERVGHQQHGNRRGDRGNHQRNQQQKNRRQYQGSGGADENNEAAAGGWPNDDADFSEWKETGANMNRGNQDNRRRSGGTGRGGGRGFYRGGGGQYGDNRRHFTRGSNPRGSNQQSRAPAVVGSTNQSYAE